MSDWTPGPWKVVKDRGNHWGMVEVEGPRLKVVGFTIATDVTFEQGFVTEADARLIAEAPALVKALEAVLARVNEWSNEHLTDETASDWMGHVAPAAEKARAVLARVRGEHKDRNDG